MLKILYAGHEIPLPDVVNVEEFAAFLQDSYAKGAHTWATFDLPGTLGQHMQLLFGPGIAVGFVTDGGEETTQGPVNTPSPPPGVPGSDSAKNGLTRSGTL